MTKRASFNTKEDLTGKLRNYLIKGRPHSKTVNEVIQNSKKEIAMKNISIPTRDHIINNEIMDECFETNEKEDVIMVTEDFTLYNDNKAISSEKYPEAIYNAIPTDEYIDDIFEHLKEIEPMHLPSSVYMKQQTDINEKMRGILIDWLVEVHLKFKLLPETLFLAVNLIDRYLELKQIMRNKLQLIGVTAMLIACKYEEIYAPEVRDFVYITDKAYTKEEILQMENEMLATLDYNVTVPSMFRYLEVYSHYLKLDETNFMFCRYLLELFLVDYKMLKYNPSLLASSSVYITMKISKQINVEDAYKVTGYSENTLRDCAKDVCLILDNVEKSSLQAVRKKYSLPKYFEVSKIKFN